MCNKSISGKQKAKGGLKMNDFNPEYRSTIFSLLFHDKDRLLSLYNALNNTDYSDPSGLTINTLKGGGVFMRFRNDVSFVFCSQLTLVEHQSTPNPNMPLRNLFYVTDIIRSLVPVKKLYQNSRIPIPKPRFVVLYNGKEDRPLTETLRLSDAYEITETHSGEPDLELCVTVFNINTDKNPIILKKCKPLLDYATLIDRLTAAVKYSDDSKRAEIASAVIDQCIREGLLSDFLKKHRQEVVRMYFWEYDEEIEKEARKEELEEAQEKIRKAYHEIDLILQKKDQIAREKDQIAQEKDQIAQEKDQIAQEKDQIAQEKDQIAQEKDQIAQERDRALRENEILKQQLKAYQEKLAI